MTAGVTTAAGISSVPPLGGSLNTRVLAAGATNNFDALLSSGVGRVDLDSSAGVANLTGMLPGYDGQRIVIRNSGTNVVTLNVLNGGSASANQFSGLGDTAIAVNQAIEVMYYAGTLNKWVVVN